MDQDFVIFHITGKGTAWVHKSVADEIINAPTGDHAMAIITRLILRGYKHIVRYIPDENT